jgi:two-component system sensor histidine kinase RegB
MVEPVSPSRINFGWLVRLRFATVAGQALTIVGVRFGMNLEIPLAPLFALVGFALASNLACIACARVSAPADWWLLAVMALDVLIFSGLLYFTGGPENPFSFLYLVPIAIAAITLRSAWTWMLVLLSLVSSLDTSRCRRGGDTPGTWRCTCAGCGWRSAWPRRSSSTS